MTAPGEVHRAAVVAMLAGVDGRRPEDVEERIDSLSLAWLAHEVSQRYGVRLADDALDRMTTVAAAVDVIRDAVRDVGAR